MKAYLYAQTSFNWLHAISQAGEAYYWHRGHHEDHVTAEGWRELAEGEYPDPVGHRISFTKACVGVMSERGPDGNSICLGYSLGDLAARILVAGDLDRIRITLNGQEGIEIERGPRVAMATAADAIKDLGGRAGVVRHEKGIFGVARQGEA